MSRIKAAQRMFPACWFNKETTEPGLDALGWYHERRDDERDVGLGPEHDWSSHSSDAFGMQALVYESRASLGGAGGRRFKRERRGSPMAV
jgi:phage terminase large subunit